MEEPSQEFTYRIQKAAENTADEAFVYIVEKSQKLVGTPKWQYYLELVTKFKGDARQGHHSSEIKIVELRALAKLHDEFVPLSFPELPKGALKTLENFVKRIGWDTVYQEIPFRSKDIEPGIKSNARCNFATKTISIVPTAENAYAFQLLAHELGHALMHEKELKLPKVQREFEAESFSYIICSSFGVYCEEFTTGHLALIGEVQQNIPHLKDSKRKVLSASSFVISLLAEEIENGKEDNLIL